MKLPVVALKAKRNSLHPWIFQRMVRRPHKPIAPGTLVEVRGKEGEFIGRGIYNGKSTITIRLLTESRRQTLDGTFFLERLRTAHSLRSDTLRLPDQTDAFRWIHGEADGLPGLIADRFGDVVVLEPYSAGYRGQTLDWIAEGIRTIAPEATVVLRPDERTAKREGYDFAAEAKSYTGPSSLLVREHELTMRVDLRTGHKTGFFLDQRDNRQAVATLAKDRSVLDCFCYTGGFGIAAKRAGARSVACVDLDEKALEVAGKNARENDVEIEFRHRDAFDALRAVTQSGDRPEILILDPPKYASLRDELPRARKMYGDLNRLGFQAVAPGGVLVTCSCSGLVSEPEFLSLLTRAAAEAGVSFQIFRIAGAGPDHPWSTPFPEGRYLKAVFGRVIPLRPLH